MLAKRILKNSSRRFLQLDQSLQLVGEIYETAVNNKEKCDRQGKDYIPITASATGKVSGNKCVDHTVPTKIKKRLSRGPYPNRKGKVVAATARQIDYWQSITKNPRGKSVEPKKWKKIINRVCSKL